eukprot:763094-Hanusia_phi.AAC.2
MQALKYGVTTEISRTDLDVNTVRPKDLYPPLSPPPLPSFPPPPPAAAAAAALPPVVLPLAPLLLINISYFHSSS